MNISLIPLLLFIVFFTSCNETIKESNQNKTDKEIQLLTKNEILLIKNRNVEQNIEILEKLFNKYCDTITKITIKDSKLIIFLQEQIPNLKTEIDLKEIDSIYYYYVSENQDWPHQVLLHCKQNANCMKAFKYYRDNIVEEEYPNEVYMFSNKKASLEVVQILKHLKINGNKLK